MTTFIDRRFFISKFCVTSAALATASGCASGGVSAIPHTATAETANELLYSSAISLPQGMLSTIAQAGPSARTVVATFARYLPGAGRGTESNAPPILTASLANDGSSFTVSPSGFAPLVLTSREYGSLQPVSLFGGKILPSDPSSGQFSIGGNSGSYQVTPDGQSATININGTSGTASLTRLQASSSRGTQGAGGAVAAGVGIAAAAVGLIAAAPEVVFAAGMVGIAMGVISIFDSLRQ